MDHAFWDERWTAGRIGFHQPAFNRSLVSLWSSLDLPAGATVFVPLCGKSLDMLWLAQNGHRVIGIEFNEHAVDAFFSENDLSRTVTEKHGFAISTSDAIEIWCGDFFELPPSALRDVTGVYDRASLIALPPDLRQRYAARMIELLPSARTLLCTVEYDQSEMSGPPFSVRRDEVERLYADHFAIELVVHEDVLAEHGMFRERGLTAIDSAVYVLRPGHVQPDSEVRR